MLGHEVSVAELSPQVWSFTVNGRTVDCRAQTVRWGDAVWDWTRPVAVRALLELPQPGEPLITASAWKARVEPGSTFVCRTFGDHWKGLVHALLRDEAGETVAVADRQYGLRHPRVIRFAEEPVAVEVPRGVRVDVRERLFGTLKSHLRVDPTMRVQHLCDRVAERIGVDLPLDTAAGRLYVRVELWRDGRRLDETRTLSAEGVTDGAFLEATASIALHMPGGAVAEGRVVRAPDALQASVELLETLLCERLADPMWVGD